MDSSIIRGTTPTIIYKFHTVSPSDISTAYLTASDGREILLEKTLSEAVVGEDSLSWTLTQQETLELPAYIKMMCNWKKADGTRGASKEMGVSVVKNHKEVVI